MKMDINSFVEILRYLEPYISPQERFCGTKIIRAQERLVFYFIGKTSSKHVNKLRSNDVRNCKMLGQHFSDYRKPCQHVCFAWNDIKCWPTFLSMFKNVGQHFFTSNMLCQHVASTANHTNMLAPTCWLQCWPACWCGLRRALHVSFWNI